MKIISLQLSNILSFQYYEDIAKSPKITFEEGLNIIIGENGSGKSTVLEVLNFISKKVLFLNFLVNQDLYLARNTLTSQQKQGIISRQEGGSISEYRLHPNRNSANKPQIIKAVIEIDEIDKQNLSNLSGIQSELSSMLHYTSMTMQTSFSTSSNHYEIYIELSRDNDSFHIEVSPNDTDPGYLYLVNYNFYKELINLYNRENVGSSLSPLFETFAFLGSYRNYNSFVTSISLQSRDAYTQIQNIKTEEYRKSIEVIDNSEPTIFKLVRLRIAEKHYELIETAIDNQECEKRANELPFFTLINQKLGLIGLTCKVKLLDKRTWEYYFELADTTTGAILSDINSLSAGQKAIMHLIFEAYGRGDLRGGLVVIDEPEIHLHYQFQNEYLKIIEDINNQQECQYILVTHSESLINSSTINKVKRFSLNEHKYTIFNVPQLTQRQNLLVKILDNTRSTYAFFAKKVVLVEGDTDRYFFKAILHELYPNISQGIAVLDIGGKGNYRDWKDFFEMFGLPVYFIADFDNVKEFGILDDFGIQNDFTDRFGTELMKSSSRDAKNFISEVYSYFNTTNQEKRISMEPDLKISLNYWQSRHASYTKVIENIKTHKVQWQAIKQKIVNKYSEKVFILREGDLESYLGINKGLNEVIEFCNTELKGFLKSKKDKSKEVKAIVEAIIS